MGWVRCAQCGKAFRPKRMGYNARYCSNKCSNRASYERRVKRDPDDQKRRSREAYRRIKADPSRAAKWRAYNSAQRRGVRRWLANYKLQRGCVDCGYALHFAALQLDHEGPKSHWISDIRSSVARVEHEIKVGRCRVRCANCHSIKTWAEKNGLNYATVRKQLGITRRVSCLTALQEPPPS